MGSHVSAPAAVMIALRRIVRALRLADRAAEGAVGLSAAQLFVVHSLAQRPAGSLAELAERTLTDQSSVSTVVAKLVARRLVTRTPAKRDRRRAELHLTPSGEQVARSAPRVPQTRIADVVRGLPAARRTEIVRSLELLAAAMDANELPPRMFFEDEPGAARRSQRRARR